MLKHFGKIMFVLFFGFLLISVPNTGSATISLEFGPMDQTVYGNTASVDLFVMGAGSTQVGAVDFWLNYNTNILIFNSLAWGSSLGTPNSFVDINTDDLYPNSTGPVDQIGISAGWSPPQVSNSSSFSLLTLNFDIVGQGTSDLWLTDAFGNKTNMYLFSDEQQANSIAIAQVGTGSITAANTSVPEPATALLFGLGLAALASLKKRMN